MYLHNQRKESDMFESVKFGFNTGKMCNAVRYAARAKEAGNGQKATLLLKKALGFGHRALGIQSKKISTGQRTAVSDCIASIKKLYQKEVFAQMPQDDRELLMSILEAWSDIGIMTIGVPLMEQLIGMFDTAKGRLGDKKEVLGIIYDGDHAPAPLRKIMKPFLAGETSQEETEKQLDDCAAKLRKWMPELFL